MEVARSLLMDPRRTRLLQLPGAPERCASGFGVGVGVGFKTLQHYAFPLYVKIATSLTLRKWVTVLVCCHDIRTLLCGHTVVARRWQSTQGDMHQLTYR